MKINKTTINNLSKFKIVRVKETDNFPIVNISDTNDKLGKMLSLGYTKKFPTMFGDMVSLRVAMDNLTIKNYPTRLLTKYKLSKEDISTIPKTRYSLKNYGAALTYMVISKIESDSDLKKMFISLDKETKFVSYKDITSMEFGVEVNKRSYHAKSNLYLKVLQSVLDMYKSTKATDSDIWNLIYINRQCSELDPFHGQKSSTVLTLP